MGEVIAIALIRATREAFTEVRGGSPPAVPPGHGPRKGQPPRQDTIPRWNPMMEDQRRDRERVRTGLERGRLSEALLEAGNPRVKRF